MFHFKEKKIVFIIFLILMILLFFFLLYSGLTWLTCQGVQYHYYSNLPLVLLQGNKIMEQQIPFYTSTYDPLQHIQFIAAAA